MARPTITTPSVPSKTDEAKAIDSKVFLPLASQISTKGNPLLKSFALASSQTVVPKGTASSQTVVPKGTASSQTVSACVAAAAAAQLVNLLPPTQAPPTQPPSTQPPPTQAPPTQAPPTQASVSLASSKTVPLGPTAGSKYAVLASLASSQTVPVSSTTTTSALLQSNVNYGLAPASVLPHLSTSTSSVLPPLGSRGCSSRSVYSKHNQLKQHPNASVAPISYQEMLLMRSSQSSTFPTPAPSPPIPFPATTTSTTSTTTSATASATASASTTASATTSTPTSYYSGSSATAMPVFSLLPEIANTLGIPKPKRMPTKIQIFDKLYRDKVMLQNPHLKRKRDVTKRISDMWYEKTEEGKKCSADVQFYEIDRLRIEQVFANAKAMYDSEMKEYRTQIESLNLNQIPIANTAPIKRQRKSRKRRRIEDDDDDDNDSTISVTDEESVALTSSQTTVSKVLPSVATVSTGMKTSERTNKTNIDWKSNVGQSYAQKLIEYLNARRADDIHCPLDRYGMEFVIQSVFELTSRAFPFITQLQDDET